MTARNVFVLTGAGISAESGLGTFRDPGGMWRKFDPMKLATPEAFTADPSLVHEFYNLRRKGVRVAQPHAGHRALVDLADILAGRGGRLTLCTQNVDDLHERAGSRDVLHMHGRLLSARCVSCSSSTTWDVDLSTQTPCPHCGHRGGMRPDVVWFGEIPRHLDEIGEAVREADLFVAIGTSGAVYPAAGLVDRAKRLGIRTCEFNLEPSDNADLFDEAEYGPASEIVPAFVRHFKDARAGRGRTDRSTGIVKS